MRRFHLAWLLLLAGAAVLWFVAARVFRADAEEPIEGARPSEEDTARSATEVPTDPLADPRPADVRTPAEAPDVPRPPAESVAAKLARLRTSDDPIAIEALRGLPKADLEQAQRRLEQLIYEATKEEFEYRFAAGIGIETLSTDPNYRHGNEGYDPAAVYWVRFTPGRPTLKVVLPKGEFPEVYELKALSIAIRKEIDSSGVGDGK
jgi:hypothetical protein